MRLLEITEKYYVNTENEALQMIQDYRDHSMEKGYTIKKAVYDRRLKKSKGEIIAEGYLVTIIETFDSFWGDAE